MPLARLVFYYLMPAGMYWVAWQMPLTERGMRNMFAGLALLGVYLALTAIAERFAFSGLVFPQYIASPATPEFLGRARGPLLNPSAEGILLGLCLGGALMSWPGMNRWGRLGLVGLAALMMTGIYCTLTRSAWMGGMAGMLLVVLLGAPRRWRGRLLAGALVLAAAVLATSWQQILEFKRDRNLSAAETAESVRLRPILAAAAWKMFLDRPISGCGFGQYDRQLPNYLGDRTLDVPLEKARKYVQHNVWLSLLTETGLTGATLFVLLTIVWIHNAWGLWTSDAPLWARQQGLLLLVLLANYFSNGMFQDVSIMPMIHMVVFFLAGLTANLHWRMRRGFWEYQSRTRAAQFQALAGHPADLVAT
jgi:O-antigen ligase